MYARCIPFSDVCQIFKHPKRSLVTALQPINVIKTTVIAIDTSTITAVMTTVNNTQITNVIVELEKG